MSKLIAGFASSHAATVTEPSSWDKGRAANRESYKSRYGVEPAIHPKAVEETMDVREAKYKFIRDGLESIRAKLKETRPDAIILVGDDQDENFSENNWPQLAIYIGDKVVSTLRTGGKRNRGPTYRCDAALARDLLTGLVENGFDVSYCKSFPEDELRSHAHCQILDRLLPEADIPIIPLFVNATHPPIITPARCYELGRVLGQTIDARSGRDRVAIFASGGISHFPAGFPWRYYKGPFTYGSISEEFDRALMRNIAEGRGEKLVELSSQDLLDNGNDEMRSWIISLGALGNTTPSLLSYEALYSAGTAMGVGYWDLENRSGKSASIHIG